MTAPDPATFTDWQAETWPGMNDRAITDPTMDPDRDGLSNLREWSATKSPLVTERELVYQFATWINPFPTPGTLAAQPRT